VLTLSAREGAPGCDVACVFVKVCVITIRYYQYHTAHSEPVCVEYLPGYFRSREAKSNLVTLNSLHSAFKKKRNK
jgi:deoxyinosine 3'endonuclease (endonuclease V)